MSNSVAAQSTSAVEPPRVFIVHGHDEAARAIVSEFLSKLGLQPIVLHEQPSRSRTIIEKFHDYADVAFAVVLLTPDDEGKKRGLADEAKPRARQNVILEFGYFLGRLGRQNVCALFKPGVDWPSDYHGVLGIELDPKGGWRLELVKELKAAGIPVNLAGLI